MTKKREEESFVRDQETYKLLKRYVWGDKPKKAPADLIRELESRGIDLHRLIIDLHGVLHTHIHYSKQKKED